MNLKGLCQYNLNLTAVLVKDVETLYLSSPWLKLQVSRQNETCKHQLSFGKFKSQYVGSYFPQ